MRRLIPDRFCRYYNPVVRMARLDENSSHLAPTPPSDLPLYLSQPSFRLLTRRRHVLAGLPRPVLRVEYETLLPRPTLRSCRD